MGTQFKVGGTGRASLRRFKLRLIVGFVYSVYVRVGVRACTPCRGNGVYKDFEVEKSLVCQETQSQQRAAQ